MAQNSKRLAGLEKQQSDAIHPSQQTSAKWELHGDVIDAE
jgi:hypothetical protein